MSNWPYSQEATETPSDKPSWDCPGGDCSCHASTQTDPFEFAVMLCDENGAKMPGARCRVLVGARVINEDTPNADGNGWISVVVSSQVPSVLLEWAPGSTPIDERYPYRLRYHIALGQGKQASERRLANLGFFGGPSLRENVTVFQRQYGLGPVTGELFDIEDELRTFHDEARLPNVPADQTPAEPVPADAPPPPPPSSGYVKLGDGQIPGQGTARSDMVPREMRLLDFRQNPASGATCQIQVAGWRYNKVADGNGVAQFRAPRAAAACLADWQHEGAKYSRQNIDILAHHQPETFDRLGNLGYRQTTLEERVRAYQHEMGHTVTGNQDDVAEQVKHWHDGGQRPGASPQDRSSFAGSNVQLASFVPPIHLPPPAGVLKILSTIGPVVIGPIGAFLAVKPPFYSADPTLAAEFSTFSTKLPNVALSITEFSNPKRPYFGVKDDEVHFSASTCKSIALFTSSLLLMAVRRFAVSVGLTVPANQILTEAEAKYKQEILDIAHAHASLQPASDVDLLPNYASAFTVTAATGSEPNHTVDFSPSMLAAIDQMMGISSNNDSKTVIHNTGFGYIHGAVVHAGLFNTSTDTGLWLAGDYTGTRTARRIPAVNDGDTAQGATTRTFVSMLDMALSATFPNTKFLADKLALSRVQHASWLTDPNRVHAHQLKGFSDERGKIGDDVVKIKFGGHKVYSEIIEFKHIATSRRFLVSYQNARSGELSTVSDLVLDGLTAYIAATP